MEMHVGDGGYQWQRKQHELGHRRENRYLNMYRGQYSQSDKRGDGRGYSKEFWARSWETLFAELGHYLKMIRAFWEFWGELDYSSGENRQGMGRHCQNPWSSCSQAQPCEVFRASDGCTVLLRLIRDCVLVLWSWEPEPVSIYVWAEYYEWILLIALHWPSFGLSTNICSGKVHSRAYKCMNHCTLQ